MVTLPSRMLMGTLLFYLWVVHCASGTSGTAPSPLQRSSSVGIFFVRIFELQPLPSMRLAIQPRMPLKPLCSRRTFVPSATGSSVHATVVLSPLPHHE